jgi:hypothetical protein
MNPFEKLLLRRAKNSDLQRSAQWLANISYALAGQEEQAQMTEHLNETMELYGHYTETEDPDALGQSEAEIGRMLRRAPFGKLTGEGSSPF